MQGQLLDNTVTGILSTYIISFYCYIWMYNKYQRGRLYVRDAIDIMTY